MGSEVTTVSRGVLLNPSMALLGIMPFAVPSPPLGFGLSTTSAFHAAPSNPDHFQLGREGSHQLEQSTEYTTSLPLPTTAYLTPWYKLSLDKVEALAAMPAGWDGHGSREIRPVAQVNMIRTLSIIAEMNPPEPFLSPISGGALQAEWSVNGRDLELVTRSNGSIDYLTMEGEDENSIKVGSISAADKDALIALAAWLLSGPRVYATTAG